ncbi:MAG: hypothetical protein BGO00_02745 [Alphaproteobacteria bacterium 62-8]|nr:MAG: hypothetical protein BGO00_02745 [Alphaproteobacteria bacterium 62-8]
MAHSFLFYYPQYGDVIWQSQGNSIGIFNTQIFPGMPKSSHKFILYALKSHAAIEITGDLSRRN